MVANAKLLSARRAYEFAPDDIRLTLLSTRDVVDFLREQFGFQQAIVGTPMDTFGPVPPTIPPGLVFNYGTSAVEDVGPAPIRLLHVEPRRIVIDVAGPSSVLDPTFAVLRAMLSELRSPDGAPAIGDPVRTRDYSELTVEFQFPTMSLLLPSIRAEFESIAAARMTSNGPGPSRTGTAISIVAQQVPDDQEFPGNARGTHHALSLEPRAGTMLSDRIYFSSAPLDTDAHLAFLGRIEAAVIGNA